MSEDDDLEKVLGVMMCSVDALPNRHLCCEDEFGTVFEERHGTESVMIYVFYRQNTPAHTERMRCLPSHALDCFGVERPESCRSSSCPCSCFWMCREVLEERPWMGLVGLSSVRCPFILCC